MMSFDTTKERSELRVRRKVYKLLRGYYKEVAHVVDNQSPQVANAMIENIISRKSYLDLIAHIYETEGSVFYLWQQEELSRLKKDFTRRDFEVGFFSEIWKQIMNGVMSSAAVLTRVTGITDKTRNDLKNIIRIGLENGYGSKKIAKLINNENSYLRARSLRIARTETTLAASIGQEQSASNSELPLDKIWVSGADARTTHRNANGDKTTKDGFFIVGGERMKYPGDPSAHPREVVNCRCSVVYVVREG